MRIKEVPIEFRPRIAGQSKFGSWKTGKAFLKQVAEAYNAVQFVKFCIVGISGVVVNSLVLIGLVELIHLPQIPAALLALLFSITSNFLFNNIYTFRECRLHGKQLFTGWIKYNFICLPIDLIYLTMFIGLRELTPLGYILNSWISIIAVAILRLTLLRKLVWYNNESS